MKLKQLTYDDHIDGVFPFRKFHLPDLSLINVYNQGFVSQQQCNLKMPDLFPNHQHQKVGKFDRFVLLQAFVGVEFLVVGYAIINSKLQIKDYFCKGKIITETKILEIIKNV